MHHSAQNLIVVEHEPVISLMIEELAQDLGWTVDGSAHTETTAFILLNSSEPKLALLDIDLGLDTGLGVAASCRDRHIPVVFMTDYTAANVPPQCGTAPIITKPFTPDQLSDAIERALAEGQRS
ncbi:MAG: response regulator [Alphaproteobacteria bacterium]|nr:MAG: response regulator [Alphaproteobacteria bacterium]